MNKLLSLFLLLNTFILPGQEGFKFVMEVDLPEAQLFKVDQFGNYYLVANDELKKFDSKGKELYSFSQLMLGEVYGVDVLDPLSIYVFYKTTNRLVIVDNRLNESSQLNFNDYGFYDVQLISFSDQENVWLYDQTADKIFRFNLNRKSSTNHSLVITQIVGSENKPSGMVSVIDKVYLNIPGFGIHVFNATGSLVKVLALNDIEDFDVAGNRLFAIINGKVKIFDLNTGRALPIEFKETDILQLEYSDKRLYLFGEEVLRIYKIASEKEK